MSEPQFDVREMAEAQEYIEGLDHAVLAAYGHSISEQECAEWFEADVTIDDAIKFMNRGCGPGDASGWQSFEEAFGKESK